MSMSSECPESPFTIAGMQCSRWTRIPTERDLKSESGLLMFVRDLMRPLVLLQKARIVEGAQAVLELHHPGMLGH